MQSKGSCQFIIVIICVRTQSEKKMSHMEKKNVKMCWNVVVSYRMAAKRHELNAASVKQSEIKNVIADFPTFSVLHFSFLHR